MGLQGFQGFMGAAGTLREGEAGSALATREQEHAHFRVALELPDRLARTLPGKGEAFFRRAPTPARNALLGLRPEVATLGM